jgi:hypothetical protein
LYYYITFNQNNLDCPEESLGSKEGSQGGATHFIISFINNETRTNQEHVDYEFTINDSVFNQALHSTYGIEEAEYEFKKIRTL